MYFSDSKYSLGFTESEDSVDELILSDQNGLVIGDIIPEPLIVHGFGAVFYPTREIKRGDKDMLMKWLVEMTEDWGIKVLNSNLRCMK